MKKIIAILSLALSLAATAHAQSRIVHLDCDQDGDFIGKQICTELGDDIANNPRYLVATNDDYSTQFDLHVMSISVDNARSAQSVVITMQSQQGLPILTKHFVLMTGINRTSEQARDILAQFDIEADTFKDFHRNSYAH